MISLADVTVGAVLVAVVCVLITGAALCYATGKMRQHRRLQAYADALGEYTDALEAYADGLEADAEEHQRLLAAAREDLNVQLAFVTGVGGEGR